MIKQYIIKDFETQRYYCGEPFGWLNETNFVEYYNTLEDAENYINNKCSCGRYQIEIVYINK